MEKQVILNSRHFELTIKRLCYELIEQHNDFSNTVLIGLQPRGVNVVTRIKSQLEQILGKEVLCGTLDITLYRDDLRLRPPRTIMPTFIPPIGIQGRDVILIDDVLYSGRTIRAALDALGEVGRPRTVQLAVLVDRGHRQLPIRADFVGKNLPTSEKQSVKVSLTEIDGVDEVVIEGEAN